MKITLVNNFHNTAVDVVVKSLPATLSTSQVARCKQRLCGLANCSCSGPLGVRGPQESSITIDYHQYHLGPIVVIIDERI